MPKQESDWSLFQLACGSIVVGTKSKKTIKFRTESSAAFVGYLNCIVNFSFPYDVTAAMN